MTPPSSIYRQTGGTETIPASEYRNAVEKPKRKNKFNARRVTVDDETFDSIKEANRWQQLRQMEKRGEISHLVRQPKFKLMVRGNPVLIKSDGYPNGRRVTYRADFAYFDGQHRIVEDVKGGKATKTYAYKLKKAFVEAMHPAVRIVEV